MGRRRVNELRVSMARKPDGRGRWWVMLRGPGVGPPGPDGRAKGQALYWCKSRRAALKLTRDLEDEIADRTPTTTGEAINRYLGALNEEGLAPTTVDDAEVRLRPLERAGVEHIDELTRAHVEAHLRAEYTPIRKRTPDRKGWTEVRRKPGSVSTRRGHLKRMGMFFAWCVAERLRHDDPTAGVFVKGRANRGKPQLTDAEWRAVVAKCVEDSSEGALVTLLCATTGCRAKELLSMRVRDLVLDTEPARWAIPRSATKTDAGVRVAELTDVAATRLRVRIDGKPLDAFVFPARQRQGEETKSPHRGRSWLREQVAAVCVDAGVRVVPPHGLRGTLATALDRVGVRVSDVAAALGHAGTRVTEDAYIREDGRTVVRLRDVDRARKTAPLAD